MLDGARRACHAAYSFQGIFILDVVWLEEPTALDVLCGDCENMFPGEFANESKMRITRFASGSSSCSSARTRLAGAWRGGVDCTDA